MDLEQYIRSLFPKGLSYNGTAQLCLRLYCCVNGVPEGLHSQCGKDGLAITFAKLSSEGFLTGECLEAAMYGANHHHVKDKGHWIEVATSVLKIGDTVDDDVRRTLDDCIYKN